jgi:hypothetical protein
MAKTLLKILATLTLLGIPKSISEDNLAYLKSINFSNPIEKTKEIILTKEDLAPYEEELQEIDYNIKVLNRKAVFYLERISNKDYPKEIKEFYQEKLTKEEAELKEYKKQKKSIYNLAKKNKADSIKN